MYDNTITLLIPENYPEPCTMIVKAVCQIRLSGINGEGQEKIQYA